MTYLVEVWSDGTNGTDYRWELEQATQDLEDARKTFTRFREMGRRVRLTQVLDMAFEPAKGV
jgi:hypothetical protein